MMTVKKIVLSVFIVTGLIVVTLFMDARFHKARTEMAENSNNVSVKTYCIGRYLIDIPNDFTMKGRDDIINGVEIRLLDPAGDTNLETIARQNQIPAKTGLTPLENREKENRNVIISGQKYNTIGDITLWEMRAFSRIDDHVFQFDYSAININFDEASHHLQNIITKTQYRAEGSIPDMDGSCLADAFVAMPPMAGSDFTAGFNLPDQDIPYGISLQFSYTEQAPEMALDPQHAKERPFLGMKAQESLEEVTNDHARDSGTFFWLETIKAPSANEPALHVNLQLFKQNDFPNSEPYTLERNLAFWNTIVESVRPITEQ
ncbi:T6SS immunity protein Tli4 family protein [Thalassospira sp. MCCC 1A01428]|uniref:T6SS immunity protein Tli4 family protein n=1 Tax=Thalassospira sp. MCCC 1A01428 TaxID=1470575 RepID=UPI000A1E5D69|nr:T6SS immunity protein Tli4 family protein [Thalassospira sp. MCCC 1A01428]OSQ43092.1 hypothetical protein THS27_11910 [Thalassospira sp. MCCC 1A01428]